MAVKICRIMIYYQKNINVEYSIKWRAKIIRRKFFSIEVKFTIEEKPLTKAFICALETSLCLPLETTNEWWNQLSRVLVESFANREYSAPTMHISWMQQRHFKKPKLTLFVQCFIYFLFLFIEAKEKTFCTRETFSRNRCSEIISLWGDASDKHFCCLLLRPLAERLLISSWRSWFP